MNATQLLKQPFPYDASLRSSLGRAAFFGLFVFGFLLVFKPFDLDKFVFERLLFLSAVYGLITFTCLFSCSIIIPRLFPALFSEARWTTGKQIIFIIFTVIVVGLVNYLISPLLVYTSLNLRDAIWFQGITILMALLPISFFVLFRQNRLLKKYSEQAASLEKKLMERQAAQEQPEKKHSENSTAPIILTGDYQHEKVEVNTGNLHLIASANNYIKVYHEKKGSLSYSIIRSTLKKTEEILVDHTNFFKCHRAYIINLDKVIHVEGNAQGYKVKIQGHDDLIPVSRNLNSEFSDKLLAYRKQFD